MRCCSTSRAVSTEVAFLAGIGLAVYYRKFSPDRYQGVGRFVHHEVGDSLPEISPMPAGD
jgi:hypothetical protein